jgi:hypothetical protein
MIKILKEVTKDDLYNFLYDIDINDPKIYEEINSLNYINIFQFSGLTAERIAKEIHPDNFEELCILNAASRPGTIEFVPDYVKAKYNGFQKYPIAISEFLKETKSIIFYQEQMMNLFNKIGGLSLEETNCIQEDAFVITNIGNISIREIVEKKLLVKVLTLNEKNGNLEWKNIINFFYKGEKEIIKIELENGEEIKCTKEHKIYTKNRGWVEAQFLTKNDELFHYSS